MQAIPDWARRQRLPGTEIKVVGGRYYLCRVSSKWDPTLTRSRKVSGEYLGRLTEEGLVPVVHKGTVTAASEGVGSKEFGATWVLLHHMKPMINRLKEDFPLRWELLVSIVLLRTLNHCPLSCLDMYFHDTVLSELFPSLEFSPKTMERLLRDLGSDRSRIAHAMRVLSGCGASSEFLLFDASEALIQWLWSGQSATAGRIRDPFAQSSLIYAGVGHNGWFIPGWCRMNEGFSCTASHYVHLLGDLPVRNAVLVALPGPGSHHAVRDLDAVGMRFVLGQDRRGLRNEHWYFLSDGNVSFDGFFFHHNHPVWYKSHPDGEGHQFMAFMDGRKRYREQQECMRRIENHWEGYPDDIIHMDSMDFGVTVALTDVRFSPERVYALMEAREGLMHSLQAWNGIAGQDLRYLTGDPATRGWLFLNHLSMVASSLAAHAVYSTIAPKGQTMPSLLRDRLALVRMHQCGNSWSLDSLPRGTSALARTLGAAFPTDPVRAVKVLVDEACHG